MSKSIEFLNKIGIEDVSIFDAEDFDVNTFADSYLKTQLETIKSSKDVVEPLREQFKKAGLGEAYLKAKKSLNKTFALGKTNSELEAIDYEDLLLLTSENLNKGKVSDDVVKERERIIAELNEKLEAKEKEKLDVISSYENSIKKAKVDNVLFKELDKYEYIVSKDSVFKLLAVKMQEKGVAIDFEKDEVVLKEGEFKYLSNGRVVSFSDFVKTELEEFIKKNNGTQNRQTTISTEKTETLDKMYSYLGTRRS